MGKDMGNCWGVKGIDSTNVYCTNLLNLCFAICSKSKNTSHGICVGF